MGYFYSLGATFNEEQDAINFKSEIDNKELILSDLTPVIISCYISKTVYNNGSPEQYVTVCTPHGLEYPFPDKKLFTVPLFYEIRDFMYDILYSSNILYNYAFYELEGADRILTDEMKFDIKEYGIGEKNISDSSAQYCSKNAPEYYYSKRLLDGLVISELTYPMIQNDFPEFEIFKKGYYWLPIPKYKTNANIVSYEKP